MALSILQNPPTLLLTYQPVTFILQSNATETPLRISAAVTQCDGDSLQADGDKKAQFDLSDYLQGLITTRHKTGSVAEVYSDVPLPVTFNFVEWSGDPPVDTFDLVEQGPYYLLDGFIPRSRRKAFYNTYSNMLAYLVATKSVLSWWPSSEAKRVQADQVEFINYLQITSADPVSIALRVTLLFTDATTGDAGTVHTVPDVAYMKLVYIPVGYTAMGLLLIVAQAFPGKTLAGYSVAVFQGSALVSRVYSYTLDTAWYQNPRTLYIKNAFGLLEVLRCTGKGEQNNKLTIEIARTDGHLLPDKISWKSEKEDVVKVNTGFLTQAQMQWLSDMDFKEAYELQGSVLHPIVFRDITLPVIHDNVYQYDAELEYEYAYNEIIEQG